MSSRTETPSAQSADSSWKTGLTTAALFVGWAFVVLVLVYFLELRPSTIARAPSVETVPTTQAGFPAPPRGAVVYSRELRNEALAVGIVPGADRAVVQASVVGPYGGGVSGLDVTFEVQGQAVAARSCGAGCYRAAVTTEGRPRAVVVVVDGDASTRWTVPLPKTWPPPDARSVIGSAERVWRSLRSLSFEETLASGPSRVVTSSWRVQAPDRLSYRIANGASAVVIGDRRWDREAPGKAWTASDQLPLRQPLPPWVGVTNARVVGATVRSGRPAVVVTFFDPMTPSWLRLVVDRRTHRTLDVRMVATAHFMHDRLHSFDETPRIRPPTRS